MKSQHYLDSIKKDKSPDASPPVTKRRARFGVGDNEIQLVDNINLDKSRTR